MKTDRIFQERVCHLCDDWPLAVVDVDLELQGGALRPSWKDHPHHRRVDARVVIPPSYGEVVLDGMIAR